MAAVAPASGKVTVYSVTTGAALERWPVDARDLIASGEYDWAPPGADDDERILVPSWARGITPVAPVAPATPRRGADDGEDAATSQEVSVQEGAWEEGRDQEGEAGLSQEEGQVARELQPPTARTKKRT